ncbi:NAD-dependent protein deacylase [[Mycoplasma] testudinis]|uniref:NAD-dependent protein deacylase n=1 Tax=[Mycoplasma] testudinis TaxID=33924 RepID=UPI0006966436|nr:NAD-dependent protein deacylase [[Mycoplasma] testudinis]
MKFDEQISILNNWFKQANKIVFFSGAGMSTASGIPDFRSDSGLYKKNYANMPVEQILSHTTFIKDTKIFYKFYFSHMIYQDAKPNNGHFVISNWQTNKDIKVITQNIDGFHQIAGSKIVYELHGSVHRNYCVKNHHFYDLKKLLEIHKKQEIPLCEIDNSVIKPDVVLYEEGLDNQCIEESVKALMEAELLIVGGTSLTVYPAAGLINYTSSKCKLIIINKTYTNASCDLQINEDLVKTLSNIK